jgi:transcription factor C subunit 6
VAAGCGNGYVAIWNVAKSILSHQVGVEHTPFFYRSLHNTYILSIHAHQPFPSKFIATAATDGRVKLTSLRYPDSDTVIGARQRHIPPPMAYSPHLLASIAPDENDGVRVHPLRQFFVGKAVGRASATITSLDAGKLHPCLLIGSADGTIMANNPMRRTYIRRESSNTVAAWQQVWFRHEWVPVGRSIEMEVDRAASDPEKTTQGAKTSLPRQGVSRFLESFRLQSVPLMRNATRNLRPFVNNKTFKPRHSIFDEVEGDGDPYTTIYEEEQAVTCIVWNPNIKTGGWAAAGMANGLLRIEDLAIS